MAFALIVLAIGSVLAGYVGVPHGLGGHNALGTWLAPSFQAPASMREGLALADCAPGEPAVATAALAGLALGDCSDGGAAPDVVPASFEASASLQGGQEGGGEAHGESAEGEGDETALELTLMTVSSALALLGIGLAFVLYLRRPATDDPVASAAPGLHKLLLNKYYVDELYDAAVIQPIKVASREGLWRGMDVTIVDGAVNGAGQAVSGLSVVLRLLQTGSVKAYAASTFLGVVVILAYYLWR
jgi:NADH-quinone oxidoreductase subunit L